MQLTNIRKNFESIRTVYGKRNIAILDEGSYQWILEEAEREARTTWNNFKADSSTYPSWGYKIDAKNPLRFKPSEVLNGVIVDLYCNIRWSAGNYVPAKQDIKMRIWSEDQNLIYRDHLDSDLIFEKLSNRIQKRRVISRFHFDRVDHSQGKSKEYHPEFHMQIGGVPDDDELCWHPKSFDIPRIAHHPMELFLACQLVAINFFPERYMDIRQELLWKHQLHATQEAIALEYYEQCVRAIRQKDSLLDFLRS